MRFILYYVLVNSNVPKTYMNTNNLYINIAKNFFIKKTYIVHNIVYTYILFDLLLHNDFKRENEKRVLNITYLTFL